MFHHHKEKSAELKEEKVALKKQIKELKKKRDGLIELTKRGLAPLEEIVNALKDKELQMEMRLHRLESEVKEKERELALLEDKKEAEKQLMEHEWKAKRKELKRAYKKKEQDMEETLRKKEQETLSILKKKEAEIEAKHQANIELRQKELDQVLLRKFEMEERIALLEKEFNGKKKWFDILQSAHEREKSDTLSSSATTISTSIKDIQSISSDQKIQLPRKLSATLSKVGLIDGEDRGNVKVISCWALDVGRFKFSPFLLLDLQVNLEELLPTESWIFVQE